MDALSMFVGRVVVTAALGVLAFGFTITVGALVWDIGTLPWRLWRARGSRGGTDQ